MEKLQNDHHPHFESQGTHNSLKRLQMCRSAVVLVILFSLIHISACTHNPKGWTDPSGKIILERGTKLKIKCVVESNETDISNQLTFRSENSVIDPKYINRINDTAIELFIPKVPEQETMYVCYLGENAVMYNDVRVGRKPDRIKTIECISRNWFDMTCTFEKPVNPVIVTYELKYRPSVSNQVHSCNQSQIKEQTFKCDIGSDSYRRNYQNFVFMLQSTNVFGRVDQEFQIDNYASVLPDKPFNVNAFSVSSDFIEIKWQAPMKLTVFPMRFDFEILVNSNVECGDSKSIRLTNYSAIDDAAKRKIYSYQVPLDFSDTWYDISIRMKVTTARDIEKMWSEWERLQSKTSSTYPSNPPDVAIGAFSIHQNGDLYVYWKHLPKCKWNGENFTYLVKTNDSDVKLIEVTNIYALYKADKFSADLDHVIEIRSKNDNGLSINSSSIVIPGNKKIVADAKFNKKSINGTYYLSWTPPDIKDIITSYTVFWCPSKTELMNQCESSINFTNLDPNVTTYEYRSDQTINFAISVNSHNSTTGMMWAKCTTANSYEIGKISSGRFEQVLSTQMTIDWSLDCTYSGIVAGYQIEYCPTNKPKTLECREPETKLNITTDGTKYVLKELTPYTTYKIIIRMYSNSTMGPASEPLANTTLEDAPTPVQNLIARNVRNTSVDILWEPPIHFNGVLVFYETHINGECTHTHNATVRSYTIENLQPYKDYEIIVLACTNKCSDPAKTHIKTAIGAPGKFEQQPILENKGPTNLFNNSYTSGIIKWGRPTYDGGNLDFYELKTTFRGSDGTVQENIVKMKTQECFMEKLCVNNVTGVYQFSIRAVNFVSTPHARVNEPFKINGSSGLIHCENDEILKVSLVNALIFDKYGYYLYGNWSEAIGHSCHYSNFDTKLTAFILISLIASLVFVVMVFYLYRKIKDMKDILIQMPPGLEDLTSDKLKKIKDLNSDKIGKPDLLHNVDNQFIMNEDEHGRLLRGSLNGSLKGNDCSSSMRSESTRSDAEPGDIIEDIEYNGFGQLNTQREHDADAFGNQNIQNFLLIPDPPITQMLILPEPPSTSTPISEKCPKPNVAMKNSNSGYIAPPPSHRSPIPSNNGYVTHSMMNPIQSNGYTQVNQAFGKPSLRNDFSDKFNTKTPIVATTDQEGISGYVTHKQLSDFGHRMQ